MKASRILLDCVKVLAEKNVRETDIEIPGYVSLELFEVKEFNLLDSLDGSVVKTYKYTGEEYVKLDLNTRVNLGKLPKNHHFDNEGYEKAQEEQKKIKKAFSEAIYKEYINLIEYEYKLSKKQEEVIASVIETVRFNYTIDDEDEILETELRIVDQMKKLS